MAGKANRVNFAFPNWRARQAGLYEGHAIPHLTPPAIPLRKLVIIFLLLILRPSGPSAGRYYRSDDRRGNWQSADRSSAGLLPAPSAHPEALIRVHAARTVRWRSIFAVHTWIVVKEQGASGYSRYDYTAWGEPIRTNGFAADARWFGAVPESTPLPSMARKRAVSFRISVMSSRITNSAAMATTATGPGPNSNTFVQAVLDAVPELKAVSASDRDRQGLSLRRRLVRSDAFCIAGSMFRSADISGSRSDGSKGRKSTSLAPCSDSDIRRPGAEVSRHRPAWHDRRYLTPGPRAAGFRKTLTAWRGDRAGFR